MLKILLILSCMGVSLFAAPAIGLIGAGMLGAGAAGATVLGLSATATMAIGGALALGGAMMGQKEANTAKSEAAAEAVKNQMSKEIQTGDQVGLGSVGEKLGRTVGDSTEDSARDMVRKKRLGTTALRIDPLSDTSTSATSSGLATTPTTGLKI